MVSALSRRAVPGQKGHHMTEKLVALRIRVVKSIEAARDSGQGSLEYIGAILVAAAVVVAVLKGFSTLDVTTAVSEAVKKITGAVAPGKA
jgi:hypothetical protein